MEPSDEELRTAILLAKEEYPLLGVLRLRTLLKSTNGWHLSEKRLRAAVSNTIGPPIPPTRARAPSHWSVS